MSKSIWPDGMKLEVVGVTGQYATGKTIFLITIAPPNRTKIYDLEKSSASYEQIGIDRSDWPMEVASKHKNGYTPQQFYEAWLKSIKEIKDGQYDVIAVDPLEDLEGGLVDYVKSQYKKHGFKSADSFEKTGGIFWNLVRSEWKQTLLLLANKCQTFAFATHLKKVWKGGSPTSKWEPKGKSTLAELASLYLHLERKKDKDGNVAAVPSAKVLKSRLSRMTVDENGEVSVQPILPPVIPKATPAAIREYMACPADYSNLKESEKVKDEQLTEEEKLAFQASIAESRRLAAEAEAATESTRERLEEAKRIARERVQNADKTADAREAKESTEPEPGKSAVGLREVKELMRLASANEVKDRVAASIKKRLGMGQDEELTAMRVTELPREQFDEIITALNSMK